MTLEILDEVAFLFVEQFDNLYGMLVDRADVKRIRKSADDGEDGLFRVAASVFGDKLDDVFGWGSQWRDLFNGDPPLKIVLFCLKLVHTLFDFFTCDTHLDGADDVADLPLDVPVLAFILYKLGFRLESLGHLHNGVGNPFDGIVIEYGFTDAWEGAKQIVRDALEAIKGFFNFQWELPKIKLPHFSIRGDFSLVPPRAPSFSVDWYARAMNAGMILTAPTIFPAANGTLRGFGDAGPKAVVGVHSLMDMIAQAVARAAGEVVEVPRVQSPRTMTVILQLNDAELGRTLVPIIEAEQWRTGVKLTKGGAT